MSRDIALLEKLGPNPERTVTALINKFKAEDSRANPSGNYSQQAISAKNLYDFLAGKHLPVANWWLARSFDTLQNMVASAVLGGLPVTSITDFATIHATTSLNAMPMSKFVRNLAKTMNPLNRQELRKARAMGLALRTFDNSLNRWGVEAIGTRWSEKLSNLTMRVSFSNAKDEAHRRAFGALIYSNVGDLVSGHAGLDSLEKTDRRFLEDSGVTDKDFQVWKRAQLENWQEVDGLLTPSSIYRIPDKELAALGDPATLRREAALKLIGLETENSRMGIYEPGAVVQASLRAPTGQIMQRGKIGTELMRQMLFLKSFSVGFARMHLWERGFNGGLTKGEKTKYITKLMLATTVLGAAQVQLKQMLSGRDPLDMRDWRFWLRSLIAGGSLGIYGDFLYAQSGRYDKSIGGTLSGPGLNLLGEAMNIPVAAVAHAVEDKGKGAGSSAMKIARSSVPVLPNLWYAKTVIDRLFLDSVMEEINPGWSGRVESKARRDFNQEYYWKPNHPLPSRAPNPGAAAGQQ
jgi:hypothetical protein